MATSYMSPDLSYAVASISEVSRNSFRLETVSAADASPNRIITFNLPESSTYDSKSLKFFFDITCSGANTGLAADQVFAKLPCNASTLISRVEVYCSGVCLSQGAAEYFTTTQICRNSKSNLAKLNSTDRLLSHSYQTTNDVSDVETICISEWSGFLNELSTRYLNTGILGQLQIRITLAGAFVLSPKQLAVAMGVNLSAGAKTNAALMTYSITNMYFTVDSISLDSMYNASLRRSLETGGLAINYKEYYNFQLDGLQTSANASSSTRFSLSSGSIDAVYGIYRDANYNSVGIRSFAVTNPMTSATISNVQRFRSYSGQSLVAGVARWQYRINNVAYPQFLSTWVDLASIVAYAQNKTGQDHSGGLITTKESFNDGYFQAPLLLELSTDKGVSVMSGLNSRGINSTMVLQVTGQVIPASDGETNSGVAQCFVLVETTAQLRIELGRDIAVMW